MANADYPKAGNESQRLAALQALNLLDTGAEKSFDRLTQMAANIFQVPIALVSLIDQDRQWFKSCVGLSAHQTPRDQAFCNYTILDDSIFEVKDTHRDLRFKDNALVTGEPYIRYYAGTPILSAGYRVATFCLIDHEPRKALDPRERDILFALAATVSREIELRTSIRTSLAQIRAPGAAD